MRGEGEGIQLEEELPERYSGTGLGAAFSYGISEKRGAVMGSEVSEFLDLASSDLNERMSSSLKCELIGDRPLMLSISASSRPLLFVECKLCLSMLGLICVYQKYCQTRQTSTKT